MQLNAIRTTLPLLISTLYGQKSRPQHCRRLPLAHVTTRHYKGPPGSQNQTKFNWNTKRLCTSGLVVLLSSSVVDDLSAAAKPSSCNVREESIHLIRKAFEFVSCNIYSLPSIFKSPVDTTRIVKGFISHPSRWQLFFFSSVFHPSSCPGLSSLMGTQNLQKSKWSFQKLHTADFVFFVEWLGRATDVFNRSLTHPPQTALNRMRNLPVHSPDRLGSALLKLGVRAKIASLLGRQQRSTRPP